MNEKGFVDRAGHEAPVDQVGGVEAGQLVRDLLGLLEVPAQLGDGLLGAGLEPAHLVDLDGRLDVLDGRLVAVEGDLGVGHGRDLALLEDGLELDPAHDHLGAAAQDPRQGPRPARLVERGDMAAEGAPGRGQVVADVAEAAVGRLEALLGEVPLALDLVELAGGVVERRLHLLLAALGGRKIVGASGNGHADDQRGQEEPNRDEAGSWHVSPPSGARIEKPCWDVRNWGETGRRQWVCDSTAPPARKNAACGQETAPAVRGDRLCVRRPAVDAGVRGRAGGGFAAAARVSSSVAVGRRTFDMAGHRERGPPVTRRVELRRICPLRRGRAATKSHQAIDAPSCSTTPRFVNSSPDERSVPLPTVPYRTHAPRPGPGGPPRGVRLRSSLMGEARMLAACRGEPVDRTPSGSCARPVAACRVPRAARAVRHPRRWPRRPELCAGDDRCRSSASASTGR